MKHLTSFAIYAGVGALCYAIFVGPTFEPRSAWMWAWVLAWPFALFAHFFWWGVILLGASLAFGFAVVLVLEFRDRMKRRGWRREIKARARGR